MAILSLIIAAVSLFFSIDTARTIYLTRHRNPFLTEEQRKLMASYERRNRLLFRLATLLWGYRKKRAWKHYTSLIFFNILGGLTGYVIIRTIWGCP